MAQMLASDDANPAFQGAHNPDQTLSVRFYSKPVQNNYLTEKEGRPIFEDVVYVNIMTPGNDKNIVDTPARDHHKARFPMHWAHFQNTHGEQKEMGTPLDQWPQITGAQAEELKGLKFRTVEHVANASDQNIGNIGMIGGMAPLQLRAKARAFLTSATDSALPQQQAAEIEKLKELQAEKDKQHEAQMAELRQMVEKLATKGKPGRKPKEAEAA